MFKNQVPKFVYHPILKVLLAKCNFIKSRKRTLS